MVDLGNGIVVEDLVTESLQLKVDVAAEPGAIRVVWHGRANERRPSETLSPYLGGLAEAAEKTGRSLEFCLERLEHFNSSTILVLMRLIQDLRKRKIRLTVVYDADLKWQKMTFEALRQLERPDGYLQLRPSGAAAQVNA